MSSTVPSMIAPETLIKDGAPLSFFSPVVNRVLGLVTALLVVLYALVVILKPDNLFPDDSYFYLQVAWNFAHGRGSTFNNLMPTNGYHPLWMLVCSVVYKVFPERLPAIHAVAGVVVLLDLSMLFAVRQIVGKVGGDLWPVAMIFLVPFSFLSQLGTEGALSGFLLAAMTLYAYRLVLDPAPANAILFNLLAALAVLARLDSIFIVALLWISVTLFLWKPGVRSLQIATMPIYLVLWGAYLASNRIYFHIWQPISGMLKISGRSDYGLKTHFPHLAMAAFAVIVVCVIGLALTKRDLFFRVIELPFAAGVLCHALYILVRMSDETHWTWYYTSWILLAALMSTRLSLVLLEKRRLLALPLAALCVVVLALLWVKVGYFYIYKKPDTANWANFNDVVLKQAGIHRALAYDQPGRLAYYSNVQVIPLDGLMGDLQFQNDLSTLGIEKYVQVNHIDGFIGPPIPFRRTEYESLCTKVYLSCVKFQCARAQDEPDRFDASSVSVYSRISAQLLGTLPLSDDHLVWTQRDYLSVWRLRP